MDNKIKSVKYKMVLENDKTVKQFFDRFYVLPKKPIGYEWTEEELKFLEEHSLELTDELERIGKDGYIVTRKKKKFTPEEVQKIKNEPGSYREKAKKYKVSLGTIYKIMRDKY